MVTEVRRTWVRRDGKLEEGLCLRLRGGKGTYEHAHTFQDDLEAHAFACKVAEHAAKARAGTSDWRPKWPQWINLATADRDTLERWEAMTGRPQ